MKAIVCIKQVPGTSEVEVDEKTGVLKRDGVESKINPYDLYAIETGVQLKEMYGFDTTVLSMGPPQALVAIKESFMMGIDNGVLLSDGKFAGADVLATAYTISQGISKVENADIIICGKQTTDGDTAQVGAEVAEFLNIPHVTGIKKLDKIEDGYVYITVDLANTIEKLKIKMPCMLVVDKGIFQPRLPSYTLKKLTENREIKVYSLNDLEDTNEKNYGLTGSPTQVKRIFPPETKSNHVKFSGDAVKVCDSLMNVLIARKFV